MAVLEPNEIFYTNFEPKTKNRFYLFIDGVPSFTIKASGRPKRQSEVNEIHHINLRRKTKGKTTWEPINITLYDPVNPSGTQAVLEWMRLHHESVTGRDGYADIYKKDITIQVLGPTGEIVEEWVLKGAFLSNEDFGDMDWEDSSLLMIDLTIEYDYAILNF